MSFIEKIYYNLNTAFSLNFMILQNQSRLANNDNNVMLRNDIFGQKDHLTKLYNDLFEDYAETRNDYFDEIRQFFAAENYFESFRTNSQYMIDEYNEHLGKNVKVSDLFSSRNIKDWELFNQIFDEVENFQGKSSKDSLKLQMAFAQFLMFYDEYKKWLSAYEIFEVLERDITPYGSKSLYHGIINNPDVFKLNFDDYHEYCEQISEFLLKYNKNNKKKKPEEEQTGESVSLQGVIDFYNRIEDRFGHANSHLMEIGSFWSRLKYKLSHMSDGDFEINEVYIHRNEILDLLSSLGYFPEMHELANQISVKFLGKNVDYYQISEKENT